MTRRDRTNSITWLPLLASIALMGLATPGRSQVVPDATLGNGNNSTVDVNGIRTDVNGGLRRGSSLFHSFDRFNIPTNFQVYFSNPTGIRNIFSRVTGSGISNIDGVLGVSGAANLFFMNPNGIIFGPNARLDISGSFFATTANTIEFPDNQKFSATGDRAVPLVEVNIPIGLQFGANPPAMLNNQGNLAVGAGQSLTLVGGNTTNTGSLTAPGGTVQVLGNQVALLDQSRIDVSSSTGGGTVLVGGDYQGKGAIVNAQSTTVGSDAVIKADALVQGNGGKVIVWADGDTRFNGTISAQGGSQGGNGGFVEVSGKQRLAFQGQVDTRAPLGQAGTLLLDPATITISTAGTDPIPQPTDPGDFTISPAAINAALASGNLILQADQSITISNAINFTGNANSLTFTANDIFLNAAVTTNGAQIYDGAVTIATPTATLTTTNNNVTFNNTVNSAANAGNSLAIATGTGTVNFTNTVGTGTNGALGNLTTASGAIQLNTINATNLNVTASGAITQTGNLTVGGTTTLAAGANDITLDGTNNFNTVQITSGNNVTLNDTNALSLGTSNIAGTLDVTTNGAITQTGGSTLTVGGTTTLAAGNANNITLTGANNFNTVQVTSGNTVSLNDINALTVGATTVSGNLNVTGATVNVPNGATVESTGGDITLNGTTSVTNAGSVIAPGRTIQILGNQIQLLGGSLVDVSGATAGTVQINGTQVSVVANAEIHADSSAGPGGSITVTVPNPLNAFINRTATNITANGAPVGTVTLPNSAATAISGSLPTTADPTTSAFNDITIVDGNGQLIITALQGSIDPFILPFLQNDPFLYQFYAGTLFQNFQIPQTALEGAPSVLSGFLTGANIILAARNNVTVQPLTNQGAVPNQLTLTPSAAGSIQLAAGGVFAMNQGDTIQSSGRSIQITALNPGGVGNSLTIGSINASSPTGVAGVGGDITLTAANGNIAIGNGINPTSIASNSVGNTLIQTPPARSFSRIQVEATTGSVNLNNVQIQANSDTGYAGRVSINAANTITATNQTTVNANGQFGDITIGSLLSTPPSLRPNSISLSNTQLAAENNLAALPGGGLLTAGAIRLGASNSVEVISSNLSSNASGTATAGAVEIQTTSNSAGSISLTNSTLRSEATGSGGAGVINLIDANTIALNGTTISNTVVDGAGGKTTISGGTVEIAANSDIRANTTGGGNAGNIDITTTAPNPNATTPSLTINNSQVRASTSNSGNAGTVLLTASSGDVAVGNNSTVSTSSTATGATAGAAGLVSLQATTGGVTVNGSTISNTVIDGLGGNIDITARSVALQNNAQVTANTSGTGDAGVIGITATAPNPNSTTAALTIDNSSVNASTVPNTRAAAGTFAQGNAGAVFLTTPNGDIAILNSSNISSSTSGNVSAPGFGAGGFVDVTSQNLSLLGGSVIQARSDGTGAPGSIGIDVTNTIAISGANAIGQVSEISTFSGSNADLSLNPGDIRINQSGSPVRNLELSDRGRINAFTQSTNPNFTGGSIEVYADNLRLTSGGQIAASALAGSQARAGDIDIAAGNRVEISGSQQSFATDPSFSAAISLRKVGTVDASGTLLSNSGGVDISTLATTLGLSAADPLLSNAFNGSGVQISSPGSTPRNLSFGWAFSTNEFPGFFNDTSFVNTNGAPLTRLADANGNPSAPNPIAPPLTIGNGNVVNIGVVNVGDTSVASSLQLSNLTVDGQPAQILVSSPDIDPTKPFISGIFAKAEGTGNAGSVSIVGTGAATSVALSDSAQISTSTTSGGSTAPSNITLTGLNSLTTSSGSLISASTNSGVAGDIQINVTQGANPVVSLTGNSAIAATAATGGNAGSVSITTPTLGMSDGASVAVSSANGAGVAGAVTITANTVSLSNAKISAETAAGGASSPANITLQGLSTLQLNNAQISAVTQTGRAGNLSIGANTAIALNNNSLLSVEATGLTGNSGNISLNTPQLTVNNSQISASTVGGTGGDINLQGLNTLQMNNGRVLASTQTGRAGSVSVNASGDINLVNGSRVAVEAQGTNGVAGNVTVRGRDINIATNSEVSTSAIGDSAIAGNIAVQGNNINITDGGQVNTSATGDSAIAGNINVQGNDINIANNSQVNTSATGQSAIAGNITVQGNNINITDNSQVNTSATGQGAIAGNVTINGRQILVRNSVVRASSEQGPSGEITITANRLDLDRGRLLAEIGQNAPGRTGGITLSINNRLTLENESLISTLGRNGANGGDITILNVRFLFGKRPTGANGSDIVGRADGGGRGGRVLLDRKTLVQGFLFRRAVDGNRTNDIDTNGQLDNFSTNADVGARGLSTSLVVFNDVSRIITSACEVAGAKPTEGNTELRITGRGGVPMSPAAPLPAQAATSDWVTLELSPQVPVSMALPDGSTTVLKPGEIYQLQATCVNGWKLQQRSLL